MRVVYDVGDGPLEGATFAFESRLPITEDVELPIPEGPVAVYRVGQDCHLWFVHLLPETV
jgi:hypothetical protein